MGAAKTFAYRIWVPVDDGELVEFQAGDKVPTWAAARIDNPNAYAEQSDTDYDAEAEAAAQAAAQEAEEKRLADEQAEADRLAAQQSGQAETLAAASEPVDYESATKEQLEAEIAKRNQGREDDDLIEVEGRGNKPDLVAALVADDATQAPGN